MNTGQTMLSIAALALLSILTMRYYSSIGQSGRTLSQTNAGFTATTIATSFIERAQNLAFDAVTDTMAQSSILHNHSLLTAPGSLGREASDDVDYKGFDDFDDFHNITPIEYTPGFMNEKYLVAFKVYYVNPTDINTIVTSGPTFLKRMDIRVWRIYPPAADSAGGILDTVRMTTLFGYYKFNPI